MSPKYGPIKNLTGAVRKEKIGLIQAMLQNRQEISFAYVYGSFTEDLPFHDIDVGIVLSPPAEEGVIPYMLDLSQCLSLETQTPVDVRVINDAPVTFQYSVIRGFLILMRDEEKHVRFVEEVIRKYLDLKPRIRRAIKEAFAS